MGFTPQSNPNEFSRLLRTYRSICGFYSLQLFAQALQEEGLTVDVSELSRWQTGKRQPKDRYTAIILVRLFVRCGAITSPKQANIFTDSINMGYLTDSELQNIFPYSSLSEKLGEVNELNSMLQYYTHFLRQGKKGNNAYYSEIEKELSGIIWILNKAYELKFFTHVLELWPYIGVFLWDTGRWEEYERHAYQVASISQLLNEKEAYCRILLEDLCWLHYWRGNYHSATKILDEVANLFDRKTSPELKSIFFMRSGVLNLKESNAEQSVAVLQKAQEFFTQTGNKEMQAKTALFLGHALEAGNRLKEAEREYDNSLHLSQAYFSEDQSKALYYQGSLFFTKGNLDKASEKFLLAKKIDQKINRPAGVAWNNLGLARCSKGRPKQSLAQEAFSIFRKLGMADQEKEAQILMNT